MEFELRRQGIRRALADAVERAALLTRVKAERARRSLSAFVRAAWEAIEPGTPLDWGWHLDAICDHVQWVFEEWARKRRDPAYAMRVQNLLVNIPPRCLKSKIVSVCAPAWAWLHWPEMTFICLSANPRVSDDNARASRDLILSTWYRTWFAPTWSLKTDRDAVSDFGIEEPDGNGGWRTLGSRKSRGWNSKITGEGADCILPDDPHDAEEVHSEVSRTGVINRWENAIWNRVRDLRSSIRIGIMQRVHESDWSGHLISKMNADPNAPRWVHLRIPLEYNPHKPCATGMPCDESGRYVRPGDDHVGKPLGWADPRTREGELMDPVRFTPAIVEGERVRLGSYGFAGQYNQDPAPLEGGLFKRAHWGWWKPDGTVESTRPRPAGCRSRTDQPARVIPLRGREELDLDWIAISVDCSFKDTATGSRVGLLVMGGKKADRFVLHDDTRPRTFTETVKAIRELKTRWPKATRIIIEDKANGTAVIDTIGSELPGVIAVTPEGGKEARAAAVSPQVEAGNVYLLDGAAWAEEFVEELGVFPNGKHDDRVDALTQLLNYMGVSPAVARLRALAELAG